MASRYQWRKYSIEFDYSYRINRQPYTDFDARISGIDQSLDFFTSYNYDSINNLFRLGGRKGKYDLRNGDKIYAPLSWMSYSGTGYKRQRDFDNYKSSSIETGSQIVEFNFYQASQAANILYSDVGDIDKGTLLFSEVSSKTAKRGSYIGAVEGYEGQYPSNGQQDGYWYVYDKALNEAPTISGSDLDLGGVFKDVSVDYIVQDADFDSVEVKISLDGVIKQPFTQTTLGVRKTFNLPIKSVSLGRHKLEIEARDSQGASSVRTYTFDKVNSAPIISGSDVNLGAKNTAFSYKYSVKDSESDNVKVVEKLNGSIIRTLYNVTLGQEQIATISDEQIREMELHKQNTIEIEASDGTATVYRRINFTRNNMPPIISDQDKDLGVLTDKFEYKFSATDPEEDTMVYTVSLDDRILIDREPIPDGREKSILIEGLDWLKIRATKHTIKIFVEDDKGFKSVRTVSFTRRVDRIVVQLAKKGIVTDEIANRVLISDAGMYSARGAITKIEVCNNSFDDAPTWEDATTMFKAGRAYNFLNKEKTAEKAGVNIRVTIGKGESTAPSYITATGGSFD